MVRTILPYFLLALAATAACSRAGPSSPTAAPLPSRDDWWSAATTRGAEERILAPRELKALLAEGRSRGFHRDAAWWKERSDWVYSRVLDMDENDIDANAMMGRITLQSIEGFAPLWERMLAASLPDKTIEELLEQYDDRVHGGLPIFLASDEVELVTARLREAKAHLDRLETDPKYAAMEGALARVRGSILGDYPYVHMEVGPFLVFFAARDLQRVPEENAAAEDRRLAQRREVYLRRLEARRGAYEGLIADLTQHFPEVVAKHPLGERDIFYQWIFGDREWYGDFASRIRGEGQESMYRCGFFEAATGWAYLFEPPERVEAPPGAENADLFDPETQLRETMAYLGATQILRRMSRDPADEHTNHMDRSDAYWLQEGWPSYLASLRSERPMVGPLLREAKRFGRVFPPIERVVERRSRLDLQLYREPLGLDPNAPEEIVPLPVRGAFTDLSWLLVSHLAGEAHRAQLARFLLSQIEGTHTGLDWFQECFGVTGPQDWKKLSRAVYDRVPE